MHQILFSEADYVQKQVNIYKESSNHCKHTDEIICKVYLASNTATRKIVKENIENSVSFL